MTAVTHDQRAKLPGCWVGTRNMMNPVIIYSGFQHLRSAVTTGFAVFLSISSFCIISCTTVSHHEFSDPTVGWQTKSGQLLYHSAGTTLIGEALVRFSKSGDFELTVSKGPGFTLLSLRQDATFAEVKGGLTQKGWSGPVEQAPPQLRGWLGLRDQFLHAPDRKSIRYVADNETFVFRF